MRSKGGGNNERCKQVYPSQIGRAGSGLSGAISSVTGTEGLPLDIAFAGMLVAKATLVWTAIGWSIFQIWVASPLPFKLGFGVFNDTEIRAIHLAFALFLAYLSFPFRKGRDLESIPAVDWILGALAAASAAYLFVFHSALAARAGRPRPWM